jgi:hypothetical protein
MDERVAWTGMLSECVVFVDADRVDLEDLCRATLPGAIVRCMGNPQDSVYIHVAPNDAALGCVGGMISEM